MQSTLRQRWGVILAGGDGTRLKPLTRFLCGDDRPKQFCPIFGEATLLSQARHRTQRSILESQTLFVLTKTHEKYYTRDLRDVELNRLIVQPLNRGTAPAILCSLLHIHHIERKASVAILPSDHYYADENGFTETLEQAFDVCARKREKVVLLGAVPTYPEVEYGWIETYNPHRTAEGRVFDVRGFWEKPSSDICQYLMKEGCLWNTFVMVGRVQTFLEIVADLEPQLFREFRSVDIANIGKAQVLESLYSHIEPADFSKRILSVGANRLSVLRLDGAGWNDLGDPGRVIDTLVGSGSRPPWLSDWSKVNPQSMAASVCA